MEIGRAVGYGLLALIDALVAATVAVVIVAFALFGVAPDGERVITLVLGAGAGTFVLTLVASSVSHYRGGRPFAFTRLSKFVATYALFYSPWVVWRRRQRRR